MPTIDRARLDAAYRTALNALLKERHPDGYWVGELSSSALSTATAIMALHLVSPLPLGTRGGGEGRSHAELIASGLQWLIDHQNPDGGWGDTTKSHSNISTTMLCRAAFYLTSPARSASKGSPLLALRAGDEALRRARHGSSSVMATRRSNSPKRCGPVTARTAPSRRRS